MAIIDLDRWLHRAISEALAERALGESFSFTAGPTLAPGTSTPIYLIVVTMPSPILGQTLMGSGLITIPVDSDELTDLVGKLMDQLRKRAAAELKVGFSQSA